MRRLRLGLPAAFALLLLGSIPALPARPFDPGCSVPRRSVTAEAIPHLRPDARDTGEIAAAVEKREQRFGLEADRAAAAGGQQQLDVATSRRPAFNQMRRSS